MYFSNIPRLNNKAYYNKVIGENKGGIYVLRFRDADLKGGFAVERYSQSLDFLESEELQLGKHEKLLKVYTTDSGLCFIKLGFSKDGATMAFLRTGFSPKQRQFATDLYKTKAVVRNNEMVKIVYDLQRKTASIWLAEASENGQLDLVYLLIDKRGNTLLNKRYNTGLDYRQSQLGEAVLSNSGECALVVSMLRDERRRADPNHEEHFLITTDKAGKIQLRGIGDHRYFLSSYDVEINEFNGLFELVGLYDYKKREGASGVVRYTFAAGDTILNPFFEPFDRKFVSAIVGSKQEKDGASPENFKVRKIIPRNDGGLLMISEYFSVTQQMETFYLNGIPQTSSKSVYNYNDLLFVSLDSAGSIEWRYRLNKRQTSFAGMAYLQSFGIYVNDTHINLVYNDNSSQSNRVMHVKLTREGVLESKIILNSENEYTAIIPLEGRQTGYNRFVTPLVQNRQTLLLELIDQN